MDVHITVSIAGCAVLASASLFSALRERQLMDDLSGTVYRPPSFERPTTVGEPTFKKAKGKFKYKQDTFSESKQKGAVAGDVPTAYTSFDQFSSVDFQVLESEGRVDAGRTLNVNPDGIKGRKRDRYRQTYVVYLAAHAADNGHDARSCHHEKKRVASVAAWIKDGALKYVYTEKPYYDSMKVGGDQFDNVKAATSTGGVVRGSTSFSGTARVGTEYSATTRSATYKGNKKVGKAKLVN